MLNRDTLNAAASIVAAVRADVIANVVETANTLGGRAKHQLVVTFKANEVYTVSNVDHLIAAIDAVNKEGGRTLSATGIDAGALFMAAKIEQQGVRGKPATNVELEFVGRTRKVAVKAAADTIDLKASGTKPRTPKPAADVKPAADDKKPADKKPRTPRTPKADAGDKKPADKKPRTPRTPKADAGDKKPGTKPRTPKADTKPKA